MAIPTAACADELDDLNAQVTESATTYENAVARVEELEDKISSTEKKIKKLEKKLPQQQARSDLSYVVLYKLNYDRMGMVSLLLGSESISDMLAMADAFTWIINQNVQQIEETAATKAELKSSLAELENSKAEADEQADEAASALAEAKAARETARQKAIERQQEEAKQADEEAGGSNTSTRKSAKKTEKKASASNVGWDSDKTAFVNKWAPRINAYLAGSPTAGTGKYYAAAAWDNGVDPRWAPAISLVESSKGAACFASYNAWGYGGSGFSSWEEGINTIVAALGSSMYGGYLTKQAAQTYCPPTWQDWYNKVANEMAKI